VALPKIEQGTFLAGGLTVLNLAKQDEATSHSRIMYRIIRKRKYRLKMLTIHFGTCEAFGYTVTKATQNEALLWKVAVLGMVKPPVGAGTFCPSPILAFYIPPCWKYLPVS
jgi:hypothetical protein